ncbi:hypothetical protein [Stieleria maiorica]|uniref:hypothetical protein n=1 Tax=Stieleria maiorica TaxID=2795974 RepID=UPI0011C8FAD1|nr:hypothetical protein [Stieleria maiorica]
MRSFVENISIYSPVSHRLNVRYTSPEGATPSTVPDRSPRTVSAFQACVEVAIRDRALTGPANTLSARWALKSSFVRSLKSEPEGEKEAAAESDWSAAAQLKFSWAPRNWHSLQDPL